VRENRFLVPGTFSSESDRCYDPPRGIFGGHNGAVQRVTKGAGSPSEGPIPAKVTGLPFAAGESVTIEVPNGAGYGDPLDRDPEAVRDDVLDDFTTVELARNAYGVVFSEEIDFTVDVEATEKARAALRAAA
jgi:N-methylhydantoinase B/oxoprolinase/acetone carboxylase alpha subunit